MSVPPIRHGLHALRSSKIRGVQLAIVVDNKDGGGNPGYRVKVKFPWLSEQDTSFWARIAIPMGGPDRGTYVLPEIDDQVLVVFEHGDINRPIVVGSLWSKKQEPVEINQSGKNNTKLIKSRSGHRIIFDDKDGAEKIAIVDKTNKNKIILDSVHKIVKIESAGDIAVIAKTNVILHANALKVGTSDGVTGKARSLLTHAAKTFGLKATSGITIGGGNTTINVSNAAATRVSGSGAGELGGAAAERPKDPADARDRAGPGAGSTAPSSAPAAQAPAAALPPGEPPTHPDSHWFELKLVDEVGAPIGGVDLRFTYGGKTKQVPTGSDGVAHVDDPDAWTARVTVVRRAQLRDALKPRWATPRAPKTPSGSGVTVQALDDQLEPVALQAAVQSTLAITPFFKCAELPGAHFAFARSFPTSDAVQRLAEIAEDLLAKDETGSPLDRKALIFGHTDLSGGDVLNKELSERRAKAIYALFTHDAAKWEELYSGKPPGKQWNEVWDVWEAQHMMNALGCGDQAGQPLRETGVRDQPTREAIHRFQDGDYPDKPAEQAPLKRSDFLGKDGRKEMFLAYAKRVSRNPVPKDRFIEASGTPFVGCGEFNPLNVTAKDAESRRVVVMVFDGAAGPAKPLPCKLGSVAPCRAVCSPPSSIPRGDGKPPYRCSVYREIADKCPCQGGADLSHDLIIRLLMPEQRANQLPHRFILESNDATITRTQVLASDTRATDDQLAELHFEHIPDWHSYRLRSEGGTPAHTVFDFTPFAKLHELPAEEKLGDQVPGWFAAEAAAQAAGGPVPEGTP